MVNLVLSMGHTRHVCQGLITKRTYTMVCRSSEAPLYIRYPSTLTSFQDEAYDTVGPFTSGLASLHLAWIVSLADNFSASNEVL